MRVSQYGKGQSHILLVLGSGAAAFVLTAALISQIMHSSGSYHPPNIPTPIPAKTSLPAPLPAYTPREPEANEGEFTNIDKHALEAPPEVEKDVESLSRYLVGPAHGDIQKARAIYRWIADRISYDSVGFRSGNPPPGDP